MPKIYPTQNRPKVRVLFDRGNYVSLELLKNNEKHSYHLVIFEDGMTTDKWYGSNDRVSANKDYCYEETALMRRTNGLPPIPRKVA